MSLCNLAGECQSKSGSARFVGDKWLEDTFHLLRSDSAAGIGTGDGNDISAAGSCQMNGALFGDGFLCIFQQVQVCTSNYKTIDEIKEHLGLPIYNRFDSIIKFDDLPDMAKEKIAEREIERLKKDYDIEDRELFDKIKEGAVTQSNAREIKHLIKETFSLVALKKICGETEI